VPESPRDNRVDPKIGEPYHRSGGYPPWTFLTAAPLVLPAPWLFAAAYFAVLDAVALAIAFVWAYQIGRPHGQAGGIFLGASAIALFAHYRTLQVGQYGILVNALLIGVYWLTERRKPVAAGIVFGLAAIKPQISALFGLIFLVRRQWKAVAAATAYVVLASLVTWAMTKTNPVEMLRQMYALAQGWTDHPDPRIKEQHPIGVSSLLSLLLELHVDRKIATPFAAITGLTLSGVFMWLWRNSSTLTLFAIAATVGRLWSYHLAYDDVMLVFLIVALGKLVITHRAAGPIVAFCVVGLSLWAPKPIGYTLPLELAQMGSWLFGLAILLKWEPRPTGVDDRIILHETVGAVS
jgi:hypothetical protein